MWACLQSWITNKDSEEQNAAYLGERATPARFNEEAEN